MLDESFFHALKTNGCQPSISRSQGWTALAPRFNSDEIITLEIGLGIFQQLSDEPRQNMQEGHWLSLLLSFSVVWLVLGGFFYLQLSEISRLCPTYLTGSTGVLT